MTKVTVVGPAESNGGVGQYTSDLSSSLTSEVQCRRFHAGNNAISQLCTFVLAVLDEGTAVHVQYVYRFFGPISLYSYLILPSLFVLSRLRSKRVIITMHEVWGEKEMSNPFRSLYVKLTHRLILNTSDSVVFLSDQGQQTFHQSCKTNQTTVIPHGVHMTDTREATAPKTQFNIDNKSFLVTQHGFVNERKGYDTLLKIAELMPDQQFLVAGGPRDHECEEYYERIRTEAPKNVTFTGVLDDKSFHVAFQASDLAILPYHDIFQSGIFNWCAAYETPTLATDIPYFVELAESYGYPELFAEGDPDDAVKTIRQLRSNQAYRQQLIERAKSYADKNSFERISSQYDQLYS